MCFELRVEVMVEKTVGLSHRPGMKTRVGLDIVGEWILKLVE